MPTESRELASLCVTSEGTLPIVRFMRSALSLFDLVTVFVSVSVCPCFCLFVSVSVLSLSVTVTVSF